MAGQRCAGQLPSEPTPYLRESKAYCEGRAYAVHVGSLVYARGSTGAPGFGNNNGIDWYAKQVGNGYRVILSNPGAANSPLSVAVVGKELRVSLGTGALGTINSTANDVMAAVGPDNPLFGQEGMDGSTGEGTCDPESVTLTGGTDVPSGVDGDAWMAGFDSHLEDPALWPEGRDCCADLPGQGFTP